MEKITRHGGCIGCKNNGYCDDNTCCYYDCKWDLPEKFEKITEEAIGNSDEPVEVIIGSERYNELLFCEKEYKKQQEGRWGKPNSIFINTSEYLYTDNEAIKMLAEQLKKAHNSRSLHYKNVRGYYENRKEDRRKWKREGYEEAFENAIYLAKCHEDERVKTKVSKIIDKIKSRRVGFFPFSYNAINKDDIIKAISEIDLKGCESGFWRNVYEKYQKEYKKE